MRPLRPDNELSVKAAANARVSYRWHKVDVWLHALLLAFALTGLVGNRILARRITWHETHREEVVAA